MIQQLLITQCRDHLMWYSHMVGQCVPMLRTLPEGGWMSRQKEGYTNIVRQSDAVLLPMGYTAATRGSLIQHGDLIHNGTQLLPASPERVGQPVGRQVVARRQQEAQPC